MVFINHIEVLSGEAAIIEINGPLNGETSPDFETYVNSLLEKRICFILLDAGNLEFVSSEGIGVILFIQKKLSENNGFFIMYNLQDEVQLLYNILGFDKVIKIARSKIDAMETMDKQIELRESEDIRDDEYIEEAETSIDFDDKGIDDNTEIIFEDGSMRTEIEKTDDDFFEGIDFIENEDINFEDEQPKEILAEDANNISNDVTFDQFVVECINCKTLVRVKVAGDYLCPTCKNEFSVDKDQEVSFK